MNYVSLTYLILKYRFEILKCVQHQVAKILGFEYLSLWQKLNSFFIPISLQP